MKDHARCRNCNKLIQYSRTGRWVHVFSWSIYCDLSGTTTAEPVTLVP